MGVELLSNESEAISHNLDIADDTDNFDCKIYNNCTTVCPDGFYKQEAKCVGLSIRAAFLFLNNLMRLRFEIETATLPEFF